jgi:uncharacterized repeat protein (TIGR01451 family)
MKFIFTIIALLISTPSLAAGVTLNIESFVQQNSQDAGGQTVTKLVPTGTGKVPPGETVVYVLSYKNGGAEPATNFVITNPVPRDLTYAGAEGEVPQVSVDGGTSWGNLASLKVTQADGTVRDATQSDVTHVRWAFAKPVPAGQAGKLSFRGVVK